MQKVIAWVMSNKLTSVLLVVVGFLLWQQQGPTPFGSLKTARSLSFEAADSVGMYNASPMALGAPTESKMMVSPDIEPAPSTSRDRMVVKDTTLSLQVKNVSSSVSDIEKAAETAGGYMVTSNVSVPEGASSGSIVIRVPSDKRTELLNSLKGMAVKVVSEYVNGRDVTDQYEDLEERLRILRSTKLKVEEILSKAVEVSDLLNIQQQLISIQSQIDSVIGQQKYLEQTVKLTKITVYLSTDEFALPYTPDQPWRPEVIFKQAVRSMVAKFQDAGSAVIWIVVYTPIWAPLLLLGWFLKKKFK